MRGLLKAEFVKAITTRALFGLLLGAIGVAVLGAFSVIMSGRAGAVSGPLHRQQYFLLASINLSLFAVVIGIRGFTDEFRHGSIVPSLLATPSRAVVLAGKMVTGFALGALLGLIAALAMVLISIPLTSVRGGDLVIGSDGVAAVRGLALACGLWSMIGVGLGAAIRSQVPAIVAALVWILIIENLGSGFLRETSRYLPGQAGHGLASATQAPNLLTAPLGALVMAGYVAVASAVGLWLLSSRDISAG